MTREEILKVKGPRKHKVNKSLGVYDAYKYIRKNKWFNIGRPLKEKEFYSIIRSINNELAISLSKGEDVKLPCKMGTLEIRKANTYYNIKDGKLHTNAVIDWDTTLKLWCEDEESYNNRTLVRCESKEIYKIHYNKVRADYSNKSYYKFNINKELKKSLKQNIREGEIEAFLIKK